MKKHLAFIVSMGLLISTSLSAMTGNPGKGGSGKGQQQRKPGTSTRVSRSSSLSSLTIPPVASTSTTAPAPQPVASTSTTTAPVVPVVREVAGQSSLIRLISPHTKNAEVIAAILEGDLSDALVQVTPAQVANALAAIIASAIAEYKATQTQDPAAHAAAMLRAKAARKVARRALGETWYGSFCESLKALPKTVDVFGIISDKESEIPLQEGQAIPMQSRSAAAVARLQIKPEAAAAQLERVLSSVDQKMATTILSALNAISPEYLRRLEVVSGSTTSLGGIALNVSRFTIEAPFAILGAFFMASLTMFLLIHTEYGKDTEANCSVARYNNYTLDRICAFDQHIARYGSFEMTPFFIPLCYVLIHKFVTRLLEK